MNKPRGRPFAKGNKLGRGRPKGSPNKPKFPGEALLAEWAERLIAKCITQAMQGDAWAMRLLMERICPALRAGRIQLQLRQLRTVQDLDQAGEEVTQAIQQGDLTPSEGESMMRIFESRSRLIEQAQWEGRVDQTQARVETLHQERSRETQGDKAK